MARLLHVSRGMKTSSRPPLSVILREVQDRLSEGELRLPVYPGGRPGQVMVPAGERVLIVRPGASSVGALPRRDVERIDHLHNLAWIGAGLLAASWLLVLIRFVLAAPVSGGLLLSGFAALLFVGPLMVAAVIAADPVPIDPKHPLAAEAADALQAALEADARIGDQEGRLEVAGERSESVTWECLPPTPRSPSAGRLSSSRV